MRAIVPHWQAQKASWGQEAYLIKWLSYPALRLCQFAALEGEDAQSLPEPVIQLLASSVATLLKAARLTGVDAGFMVHCHFMNLPCLRQPSTSALPAIISLLLPRMAGTSDRQGASSALISAARDVASVLATSSQCGAPVHGPLMVLGSVHMAALVNRTAARLLHCSGPATTRFDAHSAVGMLSSYTAYLSKNIVLCATKGCEGAPSGSASLSDLLAHPLLRLLYSPLLDTLVALQHVMVEKGSLQPAWETTSGASICLRHLAPASMQSDAMDSMVAMQVGHACSHLLL